MIDVALFILRAKEYVRSNVQLVLTVAGILLGFVLGAILNANAPLSHNAVQIIGFPGELLLRMLRMLIVPLVSASIVQGISSLTTNASSKDGSSEKLVFYRTISYFLSTTLVAVILGMILVSVVRPGSHSNAEGDDAPSNDVSALDSILGVFRNIIPSNIIGAAAENNILGVITFSLVLGITLVNMDQRGKPLLDVFITLNEAMMKMVNMVMWYAPLGILSLIAARLAEKEDFFVVLSDIALFAFTVVLGLVIHLFGVLALIYFICLRKNPYKFYWTLLQAILTAFGTDSSAATLPVTMNSIKAAGINEKISQIVLPLGVTLNMNGTALYEAVSALFVAQLHGIELNFGETLLVALTSTLAAIGAAGIPEAGLVTMTMVFSSVGLPLTDIGLLLTIDWFLDRCRTVVNVLGDCVGAAIVDHYYNKDVVAAAAANYFQLEELDSTGQSVGISSNDNADMPFQGPAVTHIEKTSRSNSRSNSRNSSFNSLHLLDTDGTKRNPSFNNLNVLDSN